MRIRLAFTALAAALAALASSPSRGAAQANECVLKESNFATGETVGPYRTAYVSGPLFVQCTQGENLRADSAVLYQATNEVHLFGRVDYEDPTRALTSDYATYNSQTGRLYARGSVVFTDRERGSTLRGPELEYFRAMAGRPEAQMIAPGRPHLTLVPRANPGQARRDPMEIDADRITTLGERFMTADGNVIIRGKNLDATSNQATYDSPAERLELRGSARVKGERYDLTGNYVETQLREGRIQRVLSREDAHLTSERLRVDGPELRLFFERDSLQRMVAAPGAGVVAGTGARSVATATGFRLEADSVEAQLPGQRLRTVTAVGNARGEAWDTAQARTTETLAVRPDSGAVRPDSATGRPAPADSARADSSAAAARVLATVPRDRDLVLADTIVGHFVQTDSVQTDSARTGSVPADSARADTARARTGTTRRGEPKTELERMVATGGARSLYRLRDEKQQREGKPPGINYVSGDTIDLRFADGEVDVAHVRGLQRGVYLDPTPPAGRDSARADTAAAASRPGAPRPGQRPVPAGQRGGGNRPAPTGTPATPRETAAVPPRQQAPPAGGRP